MPTRRGRNNNKKVSPLKGIQNKIKYRFSIINERVRWFWSDMKKRNQDRSEKRSLVREEKNRNNIVARHQTNQKKMEKHQGQHKGIFKEKNHEPNFLLSVLLNVLYFSALLIVVIGISAVGAVIGIGKAYVDTTPVLDVGTIEDQDETSFIYSSDGRLITSFSGLENRRWATIDEIPDMLQNAVIAIEDERFLSHDGVDLKRILGALFSNLSSDTTQGGSTITQQLIKLTLLSPEQTYKRKIQEAYLAIELEQTYTKDEILEAYLNTIWMGSSNYGMKAAANDYFGKELDELTLRECAMLAGVVNLPSLYNPRTNFYQKQSPDLLNKRTDMVIRNMYRNGFISEDEYNDAISADVYIIEQSSNQQLYDMPYFIEYAMQDVITKMLEDRNLPADVNANRNAIENELRTSGYNIYLTVDVDIQHTVEDSLYNWNQYPNLNDDSQMYTSNGTIQPQAAAVVFDYNTGELKAIVGGREAPTALKTFNRAYQSTMPVGSSIKPLTVYGPALDKGASPSTIVYNIPAPIDGWDSPQGYPRNYGNTGYSGAITLREGLIRSLNVVAARVLMDIVTVNDSYDYLRGLGISDASDINIDGAGLALGTSGITVLEMAAAYGAIGNNGVYIEPLSFTHITDSQGNTILDVTDSQIIRQVFKPSTAYMLVDLLTDAVNRGTGTRAQIEDMTVAGKTGTNSGFRGVFFAGMTPYYSASVWVGHDNYEPLYSGAQGGKNAAPLWQDFMSQIHSDQNLQDKLIIDSSPEELGMKKYRICSLSGKLATDACEHDDEYEPIYAWYVPGTQPDSYCDMHMLVNIDKDENLLATEFCPEEVLEESSIQVIPRDSVLMLLSDEDRERYFPNAIFNYPFDNPELFNYTNPDFADLFCTVHTDEWNDKQLEYEALVNTSIDLISIVTTRMNNLGDTISNANKNALTSAISSLQNKIDNEAPYDELKADFDYLNNNADGWLVATTPAPTAEPTAQPTQEPTTQPTAEPTVEPTTEP